MRKQMIENAAFEVATQTRAVEDIIESALVELAELQTRLIRVSGIAGVCYSTLQESFERVAAATNDMVKTRGTMAQCHVALSQAKQQIPGLRTVSWGDDGDCPKTAVSDLRIVA
jgi:hypothetical protein